MKNRLAKKLIAVLAAAATVFGPAAIPASATSNNSGTTQSEAFTTPYQTYWLQNEMQKFPANAFWNGSNANSYTYQACNHQRTIATCATVDCGTMFLAKTDKIFLPPPNRGRNMRQCAGFARKLALDFFGISDGGVWTATECKKNNVWLRFGDQLRIDTGNGYHHTIFITSVQGYDVVFADCNWNNNCQIRWNVHATVDNYNNALIIDNRSYPMNYYFRPALAGDIDGDTLVTANDITAIRKIANPSVYGQYSYTNVNRDYAKEAADLDNDGRVTMADADLAAAQFNATNLCVLPDQRFLTYCNPQITSSNIFYIPF